MQAEIEPALLFSWRPFTRNVSLVSPCKSFVPNLPFSLDVPPRPALFCQRWVWRVDTRAAGCVMPRDAHLQPRRGPGLLRASFPERGAPRAPNPEGISENPAKPGTSRAAHFDQPKLMVASKNYMQQFVKTTHISLFGLALPVVQLPIAPWLDPPSSAPRFGAVNLQVSKSHEASLATGDRGSVFYHCCFQSAESNHVCPFTHQDG